VALGLGEDVGVLVLAASEVAVGVLVGTFVGVFVRTSVGVGAGRDVAIGVGCGVAVFVGWASSVAVARVTEGKIVAAASVAVARKAGVFCGAGAGMRGSARVAKGCAV
jgi:hypothetical protein